MKTYQVTDFRKNFADLLDEVQAEPVVLSRYHADLAVLMSKAHYDRLVLRAAPDTAEHETLITQYVTHLIRNWDHIRALCRDEIHSGQTSAELQDIDAVMRGIRVLRSFQVQQAVAMAPPSRPRSGPKPSTRPSAMTRDMDDRCDTIELAAGK